MRTLLRILAGFIFLGFIGVMMSSRDAAKNTVSTSPTIRPSTKPIIPLPKVEIANWSTGITGQIASMSFKITNVTDLSWISDIRIECAFKGKSGTTINRHSETVFDTIKPKQALSVKNLNFGFVDQQVNSASCGAIAAKACCGYEIGF